MVVEHGFDSMNLLLMDRQGQGVEGAVVKVAEVPSDCSPVTTLSVKCRTFVRCLDSDNKDSSGKQKNVTPFFFFPFVGENEKKKKT